MGNVSRYLQGVQELLQAVPEAEVERIVDLLWENYEQGRRVVFCGNGGSAATASHLPADFQKNMFLDGGKTWECLSVVDSIPLLTAWSNDTHFDNVFAGQVRTWLRPKDLLIAISGSGNSANILAAVAAAHECGAVTIGISGYGGGKLAAAAHYNLVVHSRNMQMVEDVHMVLGHTLYTALRERALAAKAS